MHLDAGSVSISVYFTQYQLDALLTIARAEIVLQNILSKLVYQRSNTKYMLLYNACLSVGRYLAT